MSFAFGLGYNTIPHTLSLARGVGRGEAGGGAEEGIRYTFMGKWKHENIQSIIHTLLYHKKYIKQ